MQIDGGREGTGPDMNAWYVELYFANMQAHFCAKVFDKSDFA